MSKNSASVRSIVHTIPSDSPIWLQQPWDTDTGYQYFSLYYFTQRPGERSLNKAYELKSRRPLLKKGKFRQVPANWQRYYRAERFSRGIATKQFYQVLNVTTGLLSEVRPCPTWAERAKAFDLDILRRKREKIRLEVEQEALEIGQNLRTGIRGLFAQTAIAIGKYSPQNTPESLSSLSTALLRATELAKIVYDIEGLAESEAAAGEDKTTLHDRVGALADILAAAKQRKDSEQDGDESAP